MTLPKVQLIASLQQINIDKNQHSILYTIASKYKSTEVIQLFKILLIESKIAPEDIYTLLAIKTSKGFTVGHTLADLKDHAAIDFCLGLLLTCQIPVNL